MAGRDRGLAAHEVPREERHELARRALPLLYPGHNSTAGSGRYDPIQLTAYQATWPVVFTRHRNRLAGALGPVAMRICHVGSTAVPGLPAKPIIDIQITVPDQFREHDYVDQIESLGIQLRSRDDQHRYFRPFPGSPRDVHVHVCSGGSGWEREHLLLRDYLRGHPDAAAAYALVKRKAAALWADDMVAYTEAKDDVIRDALDAAQKWAAATGWGLASA
ncbi:MAG: GrpB family protein [Actinomycetota bacterium]|nr:GrpB family protein [Actinomycetota bacterium]